MGSAKQCLDVEAGASNQPMRSIVFPAPPVRSRWATIGAVSILLLTAGLVSVWIGLARTFPGGHLRNKSTTLGHKRSMHVAFAPAPLLLPQRIPQRGSRSRNQLPRPLTLSAARVPASRTGSVNNMKVPHFKPNSATNLDVYRPHTPSRSSSISGILGDHENQGVKVAEENVLHAAKKSDEVLAAETTAWNLMKASDEARKQAVRGKMLSRPHVIASLSFAVGAAVIFGNAELAHAGLPPDALSHTVDAAVAAAASGSSVDWKSILGNALQKGLGTSKATILSTLAQVLTMMWLHTAMHYQQRYGGSLSATLKKLYSEGGIGRLYQGLPFVLVQAPLVRFGMIAANVGMLALLDSFPATAALQLPIKVAASSFTAALWKVFVMPLDTANIALNIGGRAGLQKLRRIVLATGPGPLYAGSFATMAGTFSGLFPWWLTHSFLEARIRTFGRDNILFSLVRAGFIGFAASAAAETVSNSFSVVKTTQQIGWLNANDTETVRVDGSVDSGVPEKGGMSIAEAIRLVLDTDGIKGLFGRGLKTQLLMSCIQGVLFNVMWKYFQLTGQAA